MKKVIITGNKGLIGSAVTSYLTEHGYDCIGLDYVDGHDLTDEEVDYICEAVNEIF